VTSLLPVVRRQGQADRVSRHTTLEPQHFATPSQNWISAYYGYSVYDPVHTTSEHFPTGKFLRGRIGRSEANPGFMYAILKCPFRSVEHPREVLDSLSL
jgi:hypothetical protein